MNGKFWTKAWNPVTGCSPCSPGCDNCWARRMLHRFGDDFGVKRHEYRIEQPLHWKKPQTVFVCNLGDLFHERVQRYYVEAVFEVMQACPQHTFLVITKRPQNIQAKLYDADLETPLPCLGAGDYLPNVVLIVTVCNQAEADERIPILLQTPAATRCVLIEPMLGPVDISPYLPLRCCSGQDCACRGMTITPPPHLDGVLLGGETGPGARPMHPDWVRRVRDDCHAAGVPFYFKGWGEWAHINVRVLGERGNPKFHIWPDSSTSKWVGVEANGRILDGCECNEVAW